VTHDPDFARVQILPQAAGLRAVVQELWPNPAVRAIWLGGSFARGTADVNSDIDLRVAVTKDDFRPEEILESMRGLAARIAAQLDLRREDDVVLFHLLLDNGEIYDLLVQATSRKPSEERRILIACRDEEFGKTLADGEDPAPPALPQMEPAQVLKILQEYWLGFSKHRKVLNRNLDLLAVQGEHFLRAYLLRLYHIAATGADIDGGHAPTIHSMTPAVQRIQARFGLEPMAQIGRPMRTPAELVESAEAIAAEVARIGRVLAGELGFVYPERAEAAARRAWDGRLQR
jgi:predicted nucleotidyltransferase